MFFDQRCQPRGGQAGRVLFSRLGALLLFGASWAGRAEEMPLCDSAWERIYTVQVGEREADGQALRPYDADRPMVAYDLPGDRYLFRQKGMVYSVVGRFHDKAEGEAALSTIQNQLLHLATDAYPPFLTSPGAYLATASPSCRINRLNPVIDSSSWIVETKGVQWVGMDKGCVEGQHLKKLTAVSCDGVKNGVTDSLSTPCDATRITTCIHPISSDVFALEHTYSRPGQGTEVRLRVYDVRKKKRLLLLDKTHDGGPETELMTIEDIDQDGVPEIVFSIAGSGARTSVLKWRKTRYVEVKSP